MNYPVDHWKTGQLVTLESVYLKEWFPPENLNTFMVVKRCQEHPEYCIIVYSFTTQLFHTIHHSYLREFRNVKI